MKVNTTYEPYSREPEYVNTNRALIATVDLGSVRRVADLACGTGLLSELLLERKPDLAICAIDVSREQLEIARRGFGERGLLAHSHDELRGGSHRGKGLVYLHEGSADSLPFYDGEIDLAVMGNAIHLMADKERFLGEVGRVLRSGGVFVFNTVFFAGTFPPGSEPVYTEWLKQAVLVLEEKNRALASAGKPAIKRVRGRGGRAFSKGWLTDEGWRGKLQEQGFTVIRCFKRETSISRRGLELVAAYGGLAAVLMSGYPVEVASQCLQQAVGRAFDKLQVEDVPRYWLEVTAAKS